MCKYHSTRTCLRDDCQYGVELHFRELFPNTFTIRYANPDKSKSMIAVFGSEPESIYLVTSKGLIQKLSISNEYTLVTFHTAKLASVV